MTIIKKYSIDKKMPNLRASAVWPGLSLPDSWKKPGSWKKPSRGVFIAKELKFTVKNDTSRFPDLKTDAF